MRTHTCGELDTTNLNDTVKICGWVSIRRDHGGLIFVDLRDRYGMTQVVFDPGNAEIGKAAHDLAQKLRNEFVIECVGTVRNRPEGMTNAKMPTGEIEVLCRELKILSEARTPPFSILDEEVSELLRLKYRYLDLRRPSLQKNFIVRHHTVQAIRQVLNRHDFLEVETPILYKSTPEGARDFIVPSRLNPGQFYALPQSPQTLKQLLMVAGFDRYYQVARCFRDEDLRAERQPEFSQIDIEASFINEEVLFPIMEEMMVEVWQLIHQKKISTPFPRMTYHEAMTRYGSDKPDTRFGLELRDLSSLFAKSTFQVFQKALASGPHGQAGSIRAIKVDREAARFSRKDLDDLAKVASDYGAKGLLWIKVQEDGTLQSPAAKFFSETEVQGLRNLLTLAPGDLVLVVADARDKVVCNSLGSVRLQLAASLKLLPPLGEGPMNFHWIVGFPLLEFDERDGRYYAAHHPFTSPKEEHKEWLLQQRDLHKIEAAAYDLVLNGTEIGGGSLRIYDSRLQDAMFQSLGISPEDAKEKFGFFVEALQYGTPPHGGIAIGLDRLTAILCGVPAIRDVMAFPKTQRGQCLMSGSPSTVTPEQLAELGISVTKRSTV